MAVAYTMVDTLKKAGRQPDSCERPERRHPSSRDESVMLPGLRIKTSPNDYYPIDRVKLARYSGDQLALHSASWSTHEIRVNSLRESRV